MLTGLPLAARLTELYNRQGICAANLQTYRIRLRCNCRILAQVLTPVPHVIPGDIEEQGKVAESPCPLCQGTQSPSLVALCCFRYHEKQGDAAPTDFGARNAAREAVLGKGQSKRIWAELYKVVDSSDVVVQVREDRNDLDEHRLGNGVVSELD